MLSIHLHNTYIYQLLSNSVTFFGSLASLPSIMVALYMNFNSFYFIASNTKTFHIQGQYYAVILATVCQNLMKLFTNNLNHK